MAVQAMHTQLWWPQATSGRLLEAAALQTALPALKSYNTLVCNAKHLFVALVALT